MFICTIKMANKILLKHKGDVGDFYEPSDSENEYTEREKKLLQKVRKGRQRNTDPQQEVLAFDQNDESDGEEGLLLNGNFNSFEFDLTNFHIKFIQNTMMPMTLMKNSKPTVT